MIYITGDTHGEYERFSNKRMKKKDMELNENDFVIVCGDFGLCWAEDGMFRYNCKHLAEKKFTILWVQGNHENYDMIAKYPIEEWHGGKVRHIIRDKIILLERGQVFEIEGNTFFTFGGASSHDIQGGVLDRESPNYQEERKRAIRRGLPFRIKNVSWWEQELPNEDEMDEGRRNLARYNYCVDYVITHCCASSVQERIDGRTGRVLERDILTDYLQELEDKMEYKHWFFGHYHMECDVDAKHSLLYHAIVPLEEHESLEQVPVLGKPKYHLDDVVRMKWAEGEKIGKIAIVDAFGTYEQSEEPSYDILVEEDNCLYKHIGESDILGKDTI